MGRKGKHLTTDARHSCTTPCNPRGHPPTLFSRDTSQTGCLGSLTVHLVQEEWAFLPLRSWHGPAGAACSLHGRDVSALCAPGGRGALYLQGLDEELPMPRSEDMQRSREGAPGLTLRVTRSQGAFCPASLRERDPCPLPAHREQGTSLTRSGVLLEGNGAEEMAGTSEGPFPHGHATRDSAHFPRGMDFSSHADTTCPSVPTLQHFTTAISMQVTNPTHLLKTLGLLRASFSQIPEAPAPPCQPEAHLHCSLCL